jgi:hypothetical protein
MRWFYRCYQGNEEILTRIEGASHRREHETLFRAITFEMPGVITGLEGAVA